MKSLRVDARLIVLRPNLCISQFYTTRLRTPNSSAISSDALKWYYLMARPKECTK